MQIFHAVLSQPVLFILFQFTMTDLKIHDDERKKLAENYLKKSIGKNRLRIRLWEDATVAKLT